MSVRKTYSVLVSSEVVFTGSYASAVNVYNSIRKFLDKFGFDYSVTIAFQL